ncbi:MAG: hypothetical protein AAGA46_04105 [Cyanobacteria bacterium P01_F01_bin.13]
MAQTPKELCHSQVHILSLGAAKPSDFDEQIKTLTLTKRIRCYRRFWSS